MDAHVLFTARLSHFPIRHSSSPRQRPLHRCCTRASSCLFDTAHSRLASPRRNSDPAAKQILLHLNEERFTAARQQFEFEQRARESGVGSAAGNRAWRGGKVEQFVTADREFHSIFIG